ncbi:MAG: hypothetical protein IJ507_00700 [Clostridia bacterium]|nr:hypothetical protein [Clostridia bacterium]
MKKDLLFVRGENEGRDAAFAAAEEYGKVRMGEGMLFWKEGLRWHAIEVDCAQRIYRQVENVYGRLCCGGRSYVIERLIVVLRDGGSIRIHIGDDCRKDAEALMEALKEKHPQILYGKEA